MFTTSDNSKSVGAGAGLYITADAEVETLITFSDSQASTTECLSFQVGMYGDFDIYIPPFDFGIGAKDIIYEKAISSAPGCVLTDAPSAAVIYSYFG